MYMKKEIKDYYGLLRIAVNGSPFQLPIDKKAKHLFIYTDKNSKLFSNLLEKKEYNLLSAFVAVLTKNNFVELYDGLSKKPFAKVTKKDNPNVNVGLFTFYKTFTDENVYVYAENCDIEYYNK